MYYYYLFMYVKSIFYFYIYLILMKNVILNLIIYNHPSLVKLKIFTEDLLNNGLKKERIVLFNLMTNKFNKIFR